MMNDMKEFWKGIKEKEDIPYQDDFEKGINFGWNDAIETIKEKQFVFLWERGGKKAIGFFDEAGVTDFEQMKVFAQIGKSFTYNQDFLDCVAIDEERVKRKIDELKQKGDYEV